MTHVRAAKPNERFDLEADVVVIGFGGAGVSAALEARAAGADVLAFDRFAGGGATRKSAGVMYCGGGTELQQKAGFNDTADEMFKYLRRESVGTIGESALQKFCDESVDNHDWIKNFGVPYPEGFEKTKTSYPSYETTLYYSGNETSPPFSDDARPAARGHRAYGSGLTGHILYDPLRKAAIERGVRFHPFARCRSLIVDDSGRVIGADVTIIRWRLLHLFCWLCAAAGNNLGAMSNFTLALCNGAVRFFEWFSSRKTVLARGGVVMATGGFIFNPAMTRKNIPECSTTMRLGTIGDDGSGIEMGQAAGAAVGKMDRSAIWLFFNPPRNFLRGVMLSRTGERVCNEELYGATLSMHMVNKHDGRAILLIDQQMWDQVRQELRETKGAHFQVLTAFTHLYANRTKASTLEQLERKIGMPDGALTKALDRYHEGVESKQDAVGKSPDLLQRLDTPPYYAIDVDLDNWRYLRPSISLGGLRVDGESAQVLDAEGAPVLGLYAVGRSAVGLCSHSYVTGLSIGGAIFSGRNAGRSAAAAAAAQDSAPSGGVRDTDDAAADAA